MKISKPSSKLIQATKNVIAAKAIVEVLRPKIQDLQIQFLQENEYLDGLGFRIVDPAKMWTVEDEVAEKMYFDLDQTYRLAGYKLPEEIGFCPLLMAESALRDATIEMNKLAIAETPESIGLTFEAVRYNLDAWKKYTDLNIKYISQFI